MTDEAIGAKSRRTLAYLALLRSQGHSISAHHLDEFHKNQFGPGDAGDDLFGLDGRKPFRRRGLYGNFGVDRDGPFSEYGLTLGWLEFSRGTDLLVLSQLGLTLSTALSTPTMPESYTEVVVKLEDPYAYERILAHVAEQGPGLIIDAYLKVDGFMDLEAGTSINRFLIGEKAFGPGKAELQAKREKVMRMTLSRAPEVEMRAVSGLHDRFFIPDAPGPIWTLGISLNGIGKNFSVLTKLEGGAAEAVREFAEAKWNEATPFEPLVGEEETAQVPAPEAP